MAVEDVASPGEGNAALPPPPVEPRGRKKKIIRPAREKKGAVARCEYFLFLGFFSFFRHLPFTLAFRVGELLGWLFYLCDWSHRRIGLTNLALAFPHKSVAEHRRILRESLLNLGRLAVEFSHMRTLTKENIGARVRFADFAQW